MSVEARRLKWKCRRGLLELDLILEKIIASGFSEGEIPLMNQLLDLPDNDLLDIAMGRSEAYAPHLKDTVARLRAA